MANAIKPSTFTIMARTPNGEWFVASAGVSAVEAAAIRTKYAGDLNVRFILES